MVSMMLVHILDPKAVDNQRETDWSLFVGPKIREVFALEVMLIVEAPFQQLLCQDACLGESMHTPLTSAYTYPSLVAFSFKL